MYSGRKHTFRIVNKNSVRLNDIGGELYLKAIPWRAEIFISRYMFGYDEIDYIKRDFVGVITSQ